MGNDLAGKVALVTGASKGIGAGIATAFAQAGANVAVGYARDHEGAERVVGEIKAAGGRAITVHGDLAKTADIEAMVAKAVATFGPIDTWSTTPPFSTSKRCRTSMRRTFTTSSIPMCLAC